MPFTGMLRPGQGFKLFTVYRRVGTRTATGRPKTDALEEVGAIGGMISQASQKEIEQWKQSGHPISHTIVQRGAQNRAKATDVLLLSGESRRFLVQGVHDPGELGLFVVYKVEEREDLQ